MSLFEQALQAIARSRYDGRDLPAVIGWGPRMDDGMRPGGREASDPGRQRAETESSRELLARAREGDRAALERLCERCLPPLRRWASGRLPHWARDALDTDDLVQDTLLRTLKNVDGFKPRHDGALQAYLRQAVLNQIRDKIRHAQRKPPASALDRARVDPGPSPLEEAIGREAVDLYEAALGRLRSEEREAIVLRLELGYTYPELAEALGKATANAARMCASRALVRLVQEMSHGRA